MDVKQVLNNIGYIYLQDYGKEFRTIPLYRSSDNRSSLCIKKSTGEWYDFSSRQGGGLPQLIQLTLKLPSLDDTKEYLGNLPISLLSRRNEVVELKEMKKFKKELLLKLNKDHAYWLGRGVSETTINTFEGGTTFNGRMAYRYVFPIFDEHDNLVGFSGRRLNDNEDFPKWKHLGGKSHWLYPLKWNAAEIIVKKEVILLESVGDMLALWEQGIRNTLVTFGVEISMKIVQFLLRADMNRILIGFNNDEGNEMVGNEAAIEGRVQLTNFFDEHQVVVAVPKFKDFGVMKPEEILEWKTQHQLLN